MYAVRLLKSVWHFCGYVRESVKREFQQKYLGTQLGFLWAVLQPLAMVLIYTLVFARIMRPSLGSDSPFAYSIYLCAGVFLWGLFSELLGRGVGIFVHNASTLKKVNIPKLALPTITALSALVNFGIIFALFLIFLMAIGRWPGALTLAALPVVAITVLLAAGAGVLLGTINVFYRDVEQAMGVTLQFWFWLTPIVYVNRSLPEALAQFNAWNPMWPLLNAMHDIFLRQTEPSWSSLVYPAAVSLVLACLAMLAFKRLGGEIVDEL